MISHSPAPLRRSGMTLIELIVVIAILASVAGLVISAVSMLGRASDMAVSAATQADLTNNIQQHFVLQKRYPQGLDSLLVSDGTATPIIGGVYGPVVLNKTTSLYEAVDGATVISGYDTDNQLNGLPLAGPDLWKSLVKGTLTSNQRRSLTRGGLDWVFDHYQTINSAQANAALTPTNSNGSAVFRRDLTASTSFCVLDANLVAPNTFAQTMLKQLAPRDFSTGTYIPEVGTQVVAFGVGPQCSLLGTTLTNIPTYPGNDGKYYGRYVVYFKVYESGERASLLGVSDAYGRLPDYTQGQFNEALPNGGRKG